MRIFATADLHVDGRRKDFNPHPSILDEIVMKADEGDVLIIAGDMARINKHLIQGYKILAGFQGVKLSVLGNHELFTLRHARLTRGHEQEMQDRLAEYGFHLLDYAPWIVDGIGFVGNSAWYDGTLWGRSKIHDAQYPGDLQQVLEAANINFQHKNYPRIIPEGLTPLEFFEYTYRRLEAHLNFVCKQVSQVVVITHHVPHSNFLRYGESARLDFYSTFMGSERLMDIFQHPKVILGLTAHTHRNECHYGIHNISCTPKHPYFIFTV